MYFTYNINKMKNVIITCSLALMTVLAYSQVDSEKAREYFSSVSGAQNVDKKVFKEPNPQSLPFIALKFRTGSVEAFQEGHGKSSNIDKAKTYALLAGVDSLTFQEITNEFYKIFVQKMNDAGVTFVDFEKIKASKLYAERSAEPEIRNFNHKNYGTADVFTNDHLPLWYYPVGGLKPMKYMKETEGGVCYLRLTVDFVEFDTDISKTYGWDVTTTNFSAKAYPTIKVTSDHFAEGTWDMATSGNMAGGLAMSNTKNYFTASANQNKPFYKSYEGKVEVYDDQVPKFAKLRRFGGAVQLGTFAIDANKESYKKAAIDALTEYAETVAAFIKSYSEDSKGKSKAKPTR